MCAERNVIQLCSRKPPLPALLLSRLLKHYCFFTEGTTGKYYILESIANGACVISYLIQDIERRPPALWATIMDLS